MGPCRYQYAQGSKLLNQTTRWRLPGMRRDLLQGCMMEILGLPVVGRTRKPENLYISQLRVSIV